MKKIALLALAAIVACSGATAKTSTKSKTQKSTVATSATGKKKVTTMAPGPQLTNAQAGKKWFVEERYEKALPYLLKAVDEGDTDSKVRLAYMIFTAQVPEYSIDQTEAIKMLDECIDSGSVYALERKGFCILAMSADVKEEKLKGIDLLKQASDKGNGDASAELFNAYREGVKSYASGEYYIEPNDSLATAYVRLAAEQENQEGTAYMGLYTYMGTHGIERNTEAGVQLLEKAYGMSERFFTTNCLEPAKTLAAYYTEKGNTAKATRITTLLKKYHPTEF